MGASSAGTLRLLAVALLIRIHPRAAAAATVTRAAWLHTQLLATHQLEQRLYTASRACGKKTPATLKSSGGKSNIQIHTDELPRFMRTTADGCVLLQIHATPGAKTSSIGDSELTVHIAAPPREGAANEELLEFVADACDPCRRTDAYGSIAAVAAGGALTGEITVRKAQDLGFGLEWRLQNKQLESDTSSDSNSANSDCMARGSSTKWRCQKFWMDRCMGPAAM
ncbi:family cog1872 domain-containing protein [Cyclospora cayetanensis]|uniref:Family cog1872 domain-containing protein n=1 Tax=Cyclospora cayetanensis TaxID=88456 RepID=A0A1D3CQX4_9EIME|nr:family cog1872 domain-containing protein [Cyclospora cayetanensis]